MWEKEVFRLGRGTWAKHLAVDGYFMEVTILEKLNLIGTILNIIGKTKDTVKARLGIKKELQFTENGDSCEMPNARYTLSKKKEGLL